MKVTSIFYILDKNNPEDLVFIELYKDAIYALLKKAYESEGGCIIYGSSKHMFKNVQRYKIIFNPQTQQIYSAATYRYFPNLIFLL